MKNGYGGAGAIPWLVGVGVYMWVLVGGGLVGALLVSSLPTLLLPSLPSSFPPCLLPCLSLRLNQGFPGRSAQQKTPLVKRGCDGVTVG